MELSNEAKAIFRGRLIDRLEKDTRVLLCDVINPVRPGVDFNPIKVKDEN